jgi:5S rRNA maturation endonuclease (ribonuclease M5)
MRDGRDAMAALEEFREIWGKLLGESEDPSTVVVVEGERDRRSLRRLGLEGSIVLVHRGDTLSGTAHRLLRQSRRVIVLTDWDNEGGQFARRLKGFLEAERVDLDLEYRRRLARILRGELVHVEGLYGWARRLAERQGGSLDQFLAGTGPDVDQSKG